MSNVRVCRQHNLDKTECKKLAAKMLDRLVGDFGGSYQTEGDNYRYKHKTGVNAHVEPKSGELSIDVKLGLMARAFAPQLEQKMNQALDEYLA